jgi:hypothetical protein
LDKVVPGAWLTALESKLTIPTIFILVAYGASAKEKTENQTTKSSFTNNVG